VLVNSAYTTRIHGLSMSSPEKARHQASPALGVSNVMAALTFASRFAVAISGSVFPHFPPLKAAAQAADLLVLGIVPAHTACQEVFSTSFPAGQGTAGPQGPALDVQIAPLPPRVALGLHICHEAVFWLSARRNRPGRRGNRGYGMHLDNSTARLPRRGPPRPCRPRKRHGRDGIGDRSPDG
jgi:hypothetical protein